MRKLIISAVLCLLGLGFVGCSSNDSGSGNTCHDGCVKTMAAKCSMGPTTQEQCESDCKGLETGKCASDYAAVESCANGKPITCDANGDPTISGCDSEQSTFVACLLKP